MARYYVLAKGFKPLPYSGNFPWPYEVALCFEGVSRPVAFSEGVGHGAGGCIFTAKDALSATWADHIAYAKAEWLLPVIEQLAAGRSIEPNDVIQKFIFENQHEPESFVNDSEQ